MGPASTLVEELRRDQALIREWTERISRETDPALRDAFSMKLAKEYAKAFERLRPLGVSFAEGQAGL